MIRLSIDKDFECLIPPISEDEYNQLEKNILAEGCRDPLVTWNGVIIDGHNRYAICTEHGIEFKVHEMKFNERYEAVNWIIDNQLGRRNLQPWQMSVLRGKRYNAEKQNVPNSRGTNQYEEVGYQNDTQPKTRERLSQQYGVSPATIQRDGEFAKAAERAAEENNVPIMQLTKPQILQTAKEIQEEKAAAREQSIRTFESQPYTPPLMLIESQPKPQTEEPSAEAEEESEPVAEAETGDAPETQSKPHVSFNSGNNEWYTPAEFIEAAREVMGAIDLDPASSEIANERVRAEKFYTIDDNGLSYDWKGRVWMNPPYAGELIGKFSEKIARHYADGDISEAIILVNNATETGWFQGMVKQATAVCFPKSRIKFLDVSGKPLLSPLQGQAIMYMGKNIKKFASEFSFFGIVMYV